MATASAKDRQFYVAILSLQPFSAFLYILSL